MKLKLKLKPWWHTKQRIASIIITRTLTTRTTHNPEISRATKTNFILSTVSWAWNIKNKHSRNNNWNTCFVFFSFGLYHFFLPLSSLPHFNWLIEFCSNLECFELFLFRSDHLYVLRACVHAYICMFRIAVV